MNQNLHKHCARCARFGHSLEEHPRLSPTASSFKWYKELVTYYKIGGTFFDPRYKFPLLHVLRLEDSGLVQVKRKQFDQWWVQRIDSMSARSLRLELDGRDGKRLLPITREKMEARLRELEP